MIRILLALGLGLSLMASVPLLTSCSTLGYYSQAIGGQWSLMNKARPVEQVLRDHEVDEEVRRKLRLAQQAQLFSHSELKLPDNRSYRSYVDVGRAAVVWNVVATPPFSVEPMKWCYLVAGCMNYRGYFSRSEAYRYAAELRARGLDVHVSGASAYSTLGWFEDPIVSTMLRWSDQELVATIFHELAHQQLYVAGDSAFNEAFAVSVAEEGLRRWYQEDQESYAAYLQEQERMRAIANLLIECRTQLAALYGEPLSDAEKTRRKRAVFDEFHARYEALKEKWGGDDRYDGWFPKDINNAHLALVATYQGLVPAFKAILAREGGDLRRFYAAARRLGRLPVKERQAQLDALGVAPSMHAAAN